MAKNHKPTKRKAFSFLRSYFDVLNELKEDSDKLDFLLSIINKQFLDEDPKDLNFLVNLCYESQRHFIEKSIKGYKDKTKQDLLGNPIEDPKQDPCQGGRQGGRQDPYQQEKEKEKEEEKGKSNIPVFKEFLSYAKSKKENISAINLKLKYDSWIENEWKDGNNKPIKNWKSKLLNTIPYIEVEKIQRDNEGKNWGKGVNQLRN